MLTAMRKSASGFIAKIVILLLILSLGVWGIGDMVRGSGNAVIAKVDREEIFTEDFYRSLQVLQSNLGENFNIDMIRESQFPTLVLNELIDRKILEITAKQMGLHLSDDTLLQFIVDSPLFKDESGDFSKDRFMMVLRNSGLSEADYLQQTREGLLVNLMQDSALLHNSAPNALAEAIFIAVKEKRSADLLLIDPLAVTVAEEAEQADLETIFTQIAPQYASPEHKQFSLLTFSTDAMRNALEKQVDEEIMREYYEANIASYSSPESRTVLQATFDTKEAADAFYEQMSGSADIEKTMREANAREVKFTTQTGLNDSVTEAVFALKPKVFSTPQQSDFGWQIIYLTSIQKSAVIPFEKVKKTIGNTIVSERLDDFIYEQSNTIEDSLAAGETLNSIKDSLPFKANFKQFDTAKDTPAEPEIMAAVSSLQTGDSTGLQLNEGNYYYLATVTAVTPSELPSFEEIEKEVRDTWLRDKRNILAREHANGIADALSNGDSIDDAIANKRVTRTFSGLITRADNSVSNNSLLKDKILTGAFLKDLFNVNNGEATGAYALPSGEYVIGILKNKLAAPALDTPEAKKELADVQKELAGIIPNEIYGLWMEALRQRHAVEIHHNVLEAVLRQ